MDATMDRAELRKSILAARQAMQPDLRRQKSQRIAARLRAMPVFLEAGLCLFYVNFRSEVETMPLIRLCLREGRQLAVPLTLVSAKRLVPYRLRNPEQELVAGYCGILEPDPLVVEPVDPARLEVVVVPGSVFDLQGGRLGYGGGFYDRFLEKEAPAAVRIALAFEMQLVDKVPVQDHDQVMHFIVTEDRVIELP